MNLFWNQFVEDDYAMGKTCVVTNCYIFTCQVWALGNLSKCQSLIINLLSRNIYKDRVNSKCLNSI